jgi:hypothetical protein
MDVPQYHPTKEITKKYCPNGLNKKNKIIFLFWKKKKSEVLIAVYISRMGLELITD